MAPAFFRTACHFLPAVSLFALDPDKRLTQFVHTAWTPRDGARFLPWNPPSEWAHLTERGWRGALFVSRDGSLWMGLAEGLARIRDNELAWHKIASDQNQNSITSIVEEDDEHLWAAGTRLYRRDGNEWRCLPLHAGAERLVVNTLAAQSGLQSIDVKAPAVRLEPLSQPLDISFSGISLGHPERLRFRYRLDGIDRDWRETQHSTVSYSQIPAGDFRLRVVAIDHRGTPSEREAVWHFSVAPRWYERWWVGPSTIALTGLLIWGIASVGMARQAVRLKREFSLQLAERTRIARELHDTLLQTVQGSKILADEALAQGTDRDQMRSAIAQLSEWLGLAVREGRAALNSLRTSKAGVEDLAEAFRRAADERTKPSAMTVSVSVLGHTMPLDPLIQHQVYRVGFEAIRNAFAHSAGTRLEIAIEYAHDLIVRIADNGVGIEPAVSQSGKSGRFGLPGMRERARTIGATLTIDTSTNGTSVTLVVPRCRATET